MAHKRCKEGGIPQVPIEQAAAFRQRMERKEHAVARYIQWRQSKVHSKAQWDEMEERVGISISTLERWTKEIHGTIDKVHKHPNGWDFVKAFCEAKPMKSITSR